ncbi:hypothetical protein GCU56_13305 [Geodermatophilus sabuli]|uniref:Uncharacterized protein n=1 Tax=Geodermatophilus sabuli TaxID=1564158 RepID=A0A7K3W1V2_9ACTN|nr:hypothetical protein [Geodermatophilus sabuli]NEK58845.1 hypothetical protein [Geodermatophilus sabuli]
MRVSLVVYGLLYVLMEVVGYQLELIGWPQLTALDVATAVANACLVVAVAIAALVGLDVGARRWRRAVHARRQDQRRLAEEYWAAQQPIGVSSWRAEPTLALPAAGPRPSRNPYLVGWSAGRRYPEEPGRLL